MYCACEQFITLFVFYLCATGSLVYGHSYFGYGDGPVMMINPNCYRYDNNLMDCSQYIFWTGLAPTDCGQNEIQGLICESQG